MRAETRVGYDFAHAIVDDYSRLAYVELHDDEKAAMVTASSSAHLPSLLAELLVRHGVRHLTTEPYRPRTNRKVERFHQTMAREWAYGLSYRSHSDRNAALPQPGSQPRG
jgi:transposase InsO family protein